MEMHQLRYVAAVARAGNFSRAAEQCHVSQPSLSQQILKLEDELDERLFDRTKRTAKLTSYGQVFLQRARRILAEVEAAKREADDVKELVSGIVRVGALPTIAPYLLPGLMVRFTRQYPGVETVIEEDTTARLLELALAYEIDFALVSGPIQDVRLHVRELCRDELLLALPPRHRLAGKRTVRTADLKNEHLIVMKEGHCLGDQVLEFCDQRNLHPRVSFRSAQLETVQALVRSGVGISLVPAMAALAKQKGGLKYRSLSAPSPDRSILAVWPRERPPTRAANEFLKLVCNTSEAT